MATSPTMRKLLALVHEYAVEPAPIDSDAAVQRDLDYFDRILGILGHDAEASGQADAAAASEYRVRWDIDVHAVSHLDAARQARSIQLRPESVATVFEVIVRSDAGTEPDWSRAEMIDLTAYRTDQEVLDEIADVLRNGEQPDANDVTYITRLVRLTGRDLPAPPTSDGTTP
jgi:hypothetical protein